MIEDADISTTKLLQCFFEECERHFRFLEMRYGYRFLCGVVEYHKNLRIIRPVDHTAPNDTFQAILRYEKEDQAIEIAYGHEQFAIEAFGFYGPAMRFELTEILSAARKPESTIAGDWGITDPDNIGQTIQSIAEAVERHARIILEPGPKLLDRAATIRHARLEQTVRMRHSQSIKEACTLAARAFREKNYKHVIQILEPYRSHLKKADLKKLDRAKKSLLA